MIAADPALEVCPDFALPFYEFIRSSLIADPGAQAQNHEEAAQALTDAWAAHNAQRCDDYTRQQDELEIQGPGRPEDQQEPPQIRQPTRPPSPVELEPERQPAQSNRRRPAPPTVRRDIIVSTNLQPRPSSFAISKLENFKYIDLWYFTRAGCSEAAAQAKAADNEGLSLTGGHNNERLGLRTTSTATASKNAILDEALPWGEFTQSRYAYLNYLPKAGWPKELYTDMAAFFVRVETHPLARMGDMGQKVLLEYQARARRDWHDHAKRGEVFNIAELNEDLIKIIKDEQQARNNERVSPPAQNHHNPD
ncbi:hypothetical protein BD779DRAFT_1448719 [Infundibulicybe gibba]|nr:hypothetical protein BD779DRAFT_1448719 [Infundibulicybe gibba]